MNCVMELYPNWLQIHLNQELFDPKSVGTMRLEFHGEGCHCNDEKYRPGYVTQLLKIKGIIEVDMERYAIFICKGKAFTWEENILSILFHILLGLEPTGEIKQIKPALEYYSENLNAPNLKTRLIKLPIPDPLRLPTKEKKNKEDKK